MTIDEKYEDLKKRIQSFPSVAVAFSGGVDSTFLAKVCNDVLGKQAVAITLISPMNAKSEMDEARQLAKEIGIAHYCLTDNEIEEPVANNAPDRCYHCKKTEFGKIIEKANELGIYTVLDGSNVDDLNDYRPGFKALNELSICSPLRQSGLNKEEIRELSRQLGLPTWSKPALACLASRVPYGEKITHKKLSMIELSEDFLRGLGFVQFRVRAHADLARIEVSPAERPKLFDTTLLDHISQQLKSFGFSYVCIELEGYLMGSLNRNLTETQK